MLKEKIVRFFKELLTEQDEWRPLPSNMNSRRLEEPEAQELESLFSEDEVFNALVNLGSDKAPGPDVCTIDFWVFNLEILKADVIKFFKDFHVTRKFTRGLYATYLVLVPKK